ncbi:hypothetical protein SAMN05216556_11971, partial [Aequorivita viscosa]
AIANNESEDIENLYFKVPSILVTPQLFVLSRRNLDSYFFMRLTTN